MRFLGCSFSGIGPGQIVGDIYASEHQATMFPEINNQLLNLADIVPSLSRITSSLWLSDSWRNLSFCYGWIPDIPIYLFMALALFFIHTMSSCNTLFYSLFIFHFALPDVLVFDMIWLDSIQNKSFWLYLGTRDNSKSIPILSDRKREKRITGLWVDLIISATFQRQHSIELMMLGRDTGLCSQLWNVLQS